MAGHSQAENSMSPAPAAKG